LLGSLNPLQSIDRRNGALSRFLKSSAVSLPHGGGGKGAGTASRARPGQGDVPAGELYDHHYREVFRCAWPVLVHSRDCAKALLGWSIQPLSTCPLEKT